MQKLLASPLVADKIIGGSEAVHHLETSYYDTPSFKLMHSGIAYRVRKNGCTAALLTVCAKTAINTKQPLKRKKKLTAGFPAATNIMLICLTASLFCRGLKKKALIRIWPDGKPVLQGFKEEGFDTDLEKLIAGEPLVKLFTVDVERRLCLLKISSATTVELAVDRGKIISGITGNECAVNETELEIKSGTKEDLLAYAGQIANLVPVTPENCSKYERGMKLCGINLTKPAK